MKLRAKYLTLMTGTTVILLVAFGATQVWLSFRQLRASNDTVLRLEAAVVSAFTRNGDLDFGTAAMVRSMVDTVGREREIGRAHV